jgi:hypothetical protein
MPALHSPAERGDEGFDVSLFVRPSTLNPQPTTVLRLRKSGREFVEWHNENKFRR